MASPNLREKDVDIGSTTRMWDCLPITVSNNQQGWNLWVENFIVSWYIWPAFISEKSNGEKPEFCNSMSFRQFFVSIFIFFVKMFVIVIRIVQPKQGTFK